jgi:hypothetical protein
MIDMALSKGEEWPTEYHRKVAINLLIANPEVTTMTSLQNGVNKIMKIPDDKIQQVTINDLSDYGFNVDTTISP